MAMIDRDRREGANSRLSRRWRRRRAQRGAAVFIVMMAIVLLSGLGMWSMYSAGLVDQASGYSRAARQTQYAAELGVQSATAYLSLPGYAQTNYDLAYKNPDDCESIELGFCKRIHDEDIDDVTQTQQNVNVMDNTNAQGSFSPWANTEAGALEGHFRVEMTEPAKALVAGSSATKSNYYRVTLSSYGMVRPNTGGAALCDAAATSQNTAAGFLGMRAHAIIGPIAE